MSIGVKKQEEGGQKQEVPVKPKEGPRLEMDINVGIWRGHWPKELHQIINIEDNLLVRYDSKDHVLDMVEFDAKERTVCAVAEISLGELELPPFHSVHHFLSKGDPFLFCLATDRKRYVIFRAANKRFGPPATGSLMFSPSHCVVFKYRHMHYLLCYSSRSGEYQVLSMGPLCNPKMDIMAAIVSQGRFRPGWTDVIWKGTTHVRCTRQKFFCYNCETGEVAFECVWVRGASTSSSIASQEHITLPMGAPPPGDKPETDLQRILKKKGCVAMPLHIAGRTVCLLYSHSALSRDAKQSGAQGSSRLPAGDTTHKVSAAASASAAAVAESSALLLQKRVFAHEQPWSHFCMLQDRSDAQGGDLLCYSASSGDVWVSQLFACKEGNSPVRDVTLREDVGKEHANQNEAEGSLAGSQRVVKFSKDQQQAASVRGGGSQHSGDQASSTGAGGAGGGKAAGGGSLAGSQRQQGNRLGFRQLTTQTLRQVAVSSIDINEYADQTGVGDDFAFPVDGENGEKKAHHQRSRHHGDKRSHGDTHSASGNSQRSGSQQSGRNNQSSKKSRPTSGAFRNPVSARPASSGRSVGQRLAEMETTGDYHTDIARYVKHLQNTDFAADSPTSKMDLAEIIAQMSQPSETELMQGTGSIQTRSSSQRAQSARGPNTGAGHNGMPPWRSCLGDHELLPSKWLTQLDGKLAEHRETEVPEYKMTEKQILRLYQGQQNREQYQEKHIQKMLKEMKDNEVSQTGRKKRQEALEPLNAKHVHTLVDRLGVQDIESRHKKKESRDKKYLVQPSHLKFAQHEMDDFVNRVAVEGVQHKIEKQKRAEKKAHAPITPPHAPLSKEQLMAVNTRLTDQSKERKEAEKARILAIMDQDGGLVERSCRSPEQVRYNSKRLFLGKSEAQADAMGMDY